MSGPDLINPGCINTCKQLEQPGFGMRVKGNPRVTVIIEGLSTVYSTVTLF